MLVRKDVPWNWSSTQKESFKNIKKHIADAPMLAIYDQNKELLYKMMRASMG